MESKQQKSIDFVRGRQLSALRGATLPSVPVDARCVSGRTMKAVLMAIDSRVGKSGTCWASAATLAIDAGLSSRSVERALTGLRKLDLIIESDIEGGRANTKTRRICFANLIEFENQIEPARSETGAVRSETGAVCSETGARSFRNAFGQREQKGTRREIQGPTDGFLKIDYEGVTLQVEQLIEGETLDRLFEQAIESGMLKRCEADRLALFGFGCRCYRRRRDLKNAVGFFLHGIGQGRQWLSAQVDDEHDRKQARKLICEADGQSDALTERKTAGASQSQSLRDFEAERDRQRRALAEFIGGQK